MRLRLLESGAHGIRQRAGAVVLVATRLTGSVFSEVDAFDVVAVLGMLWEHLLSDRGQCRDARCGKRSRWCGAGAAARRLAAAREYQNERNQRVERMRSGHRYPSLSSC